MQPLTPLLGYRMSMIFLAALFAPSLYGCWEADHSERDVPGTLATRPPPPSTAPKAIVLLTIDTLRNDHTGPGGYEFPTTPFLDEVAKRGINFTQAVATSSFTPTSMASVMTGLYPRSHGVEYGYFDPVKRTAVQDKLPESITTLAEALQGQGYRTVGVPSNRHLAADLGFAQGFDNYYGESGFSTAVALNDRAKRMMADTFGKEIKSAWRGKWPFLWVHYVDPHDPYTKRPTWPLPSMEPMDQASADALDSKTHVQLKTHFERSDPTGLKTLKTLYDGDIHATDKNARRLWRMFGFDDDVLLIITSDHGEEFLEHGHLGHAKSLHQESVHVPLLISWPAALPQGMTVETPVSIVDIYPTIREILAMDVDPAIQGQSLLPLIKGEKFSQERPLFMELTRVNIEQVATLDGTMKHIEAMKPSPWRGSFDIAEDPLEQNNLYDVDSDASQGAFKRLDRLIKELAAPPEDSQEASISDPEEVEALKAMGYIE